MSEIFLTPKELAERWKVTTGSLANMRHKFKGPKYINLSGIRYRLEDILEYERLCETHK